MQSMGSMTTCAPLQAAARRLMAVHLLLRMSSDDYRTGAHYGADPHYIMGSLIMLVVPCESTKPPWVHPREGSGTNVLLGCST